MELLNAVRDAVAAGLVCDNPGLSVKAVLTAMQDQDAEVANELQIAIVTEAAAFAASQTVTIREKAVLHAREGVSPLIVFDLERPLQAPSFMSGLGGETLIRKN